MPPMNNTTLENVNPAPHLEGGKPVFDSTWIRLPRARTRCQVCGLSRSTLAELVRPCERNGYRPPVEARMLRRKGSSRGVLLINRAALLEFLNELPAPQRAEQPATVADTTEAAADLAGETERAVPSAPLAGTDLSSLAEGGTQ